MDLEDLVEEPGVVEAEVEELEEKVPVMLEGVEEAQEHPDLPRPTPSLSRGRFHDFGAQTSLEGEVRVVERIRRDLPRQVGVRSLFLCLRDLRRC